MHFTCLPFLIILIPDPFSVVLTTELENNACSDFDSYYNISKSENCYHIPDISEDVPVIIKRHIGFFEEHKIKTEDDYILTVFRIPKDDPKGVIVLGHCFGFDSKIWVSQCNESTAFLFWKAGYDVWLLNFRGTSYSKEHQFLDIASPEFWDFSFHEIGYYDLEASFDYVKKIHGLTRKIIYIAHSLGTMTGLAYTALRPERALHNLEVMILMAPIANLKHLTTPLKYISFLQDLNLQGVNKFFKHHSFLDHEGGFVKFIRSMFNNYPVQKLVNFQLSYFWGWTPDEFDPRFMNLMWSQFGSEISLKVLYHLQQLYLSGGNMQMYDYGPQKNIKVYGAKTPSLYPLSNISVPVLLIHSRNDTGSHPKDVEELYNTLSEKAKIYGKIEVQGLNHIDFHFGKNRIQKVYNKILQFLDTLEENKGGINATKADETTAAQFRVVYGYFGICGILFLTVFYLDSYWLR